MLADKSPEKKVGIYELLIYIVKKITGDCENDIKYLHIWCKKLQCFMGNDVIGCDPIVCILLISSCILLISTDFDLLFYCFLQS